LSGTSQIFKLQNTNHSEINTAIYSLKSKLKSEVEKEHFSLNTKYFIIGLVIAAPFLIFMLTNSFFSFPLVVIILLYMCLFIGFHYLLKAPTTMGRKVMDEIEGFQMYLKTAEQHRMEGVDTPDENIKLFEKFLPYASGFKL
jgi:hypothetical protein